MRVDVMLSAAKKLEKETVTIEGWLINDSNRGLGQLFYMVEDKLHYDDTRRAILIVRGTRGSSADEIALADALNFIAPYGRLSPLEARITGTLDCTDRAFPFTLTHITSIEVMIPKWGYTGYYIPQGINYDELGVEKLSPIAVFDLLSNKDLFIGTRIKVEGILTGRNATRDTPELCYMTDRRYLANPPMPEPVLSENVPLQFVEDIQTRQKQRRSIFEAKLVRERKNAVHLKYNGILRKIIRPHYSGRSFFENAIAIGSVDSADTAPFPLALVNVSTLIIKNMKNDRRNVQIWDLERFPYGHKI